MDVEGEELNVEDVREHRAAPFRGVYPVSVATAQPVNVIPGHESNSLISRLLSHMGRRHELRLANTGLSQQHNRDLGLHPEVQAFL